MIGEKIYATQQYVDEKIAQSGGNSGGESSSSIQIDSTLTITGAAADAKIVGDKIGDLSTLITAAKNNLVEAINEAAEPATIENLIPYYDLITDFNLPPIPDNGDNISINKTSSNLWEDLTNGPLKVKFQVSVEGTILNIERVITPNYSIEQDIYEVNIPVRWYSTYGFIVLQFTKSSNQISIYGWYDEIKIEDTNEGISIPTIDLAEFNFNTPLDVNGGSYGKFNVSSDEPPVLASVEETSTDYTDIINKIIEGPVQLVFQLKDNDTIINASAIVNQYSKNEDIYNCAGLIWYNHIPLLLNFEFSATSMWVQLFNMDKETLGANEIPNLYIWEKSPVKITTVETEVTNYPLSDYSAPNLNNWETVSYSDSYSITDGEITLDNPEEFIMNETSDNSVILGKYIISSLYNRCYYIPTDANIYSEAYTSSSGAYIKVDKATYIYLTKGPSDEIIYVASKNNTTYPTNGEHTDGYWYYYKKQLAEDSVSEGVPASTITTAIAEHNISTSAHEDIRQKIVQANYAENNSSSMSYIKNRPFYDEGEIVEIPIVTEVEIPFENVEENVWMYQSSAAPTIPEEGTEYKIVFGDKVYNYPCKVEQIDGNTFYSLGASYMEIMMVNQIKAYPLEPISIIILPNGNNITFVFDSETAPGPFSLYKVVSVKEATIINDTYTLLRDGTTSDFISMLPSFDLIPEATYTITVDGVENTLTCSIDNAEYLDPIWIYILETDNMAVILGNTVSFIEYTDATIASDITSIEKNVKVTGYVSGIKKLSAKYIDGNISSSDSSGSDNSGSTLPSVTTADNDKVLMVVNGVWAAASITSGDEVAY